MRKSWKKSRATRSNKTSDFLTVQLRGNLISTWVELSGGGLTLPLVGLYPFLFCLLPKSFVFHLVLFFSARLRFQCFFCFLSHCLQTSPGRTCHNNHTAAWTDLLLTLLMFTNTDYWKKRIIVLVRRKQDFWNACEHVSLTDILWNQTSQNRPTHSGNAVGDLITPAFICSTRLKWALALCTLSYIPSFF